MDRSGLLDGEYLMLAACPDGILRFVVEQAGEDLPSRRAE